MKSSQQLRVMFKVDLEADCKHSYGRGSSDRVGWGEGAGVFTRKMKPELPPLVGFFHDLLQHRWVGGWGGGE